MRRGIDDHIDESVNTILDVPVDTLMKIISQINKDLAASDMPTVREEQLRRSIRASFNCEYFVPSQSSLK